MNKEKLYQLSAIIVFSVASIIFLYIYYNQLVQLILDRYLGNGFLVSFFPALVDSLILIIETMLFLFITKPLVRAYFEKKGKSAQAELFVSFYSYFVWFFALVLILSTIFKDLGALIASLGLIGFGLTLALQKPILNFVGWLNIVMTNPFNVGERIEVSGILGEVISINTMFTRVQGLFKSSQSKNENIITIPNEVLLTNPVMNYSRLGGLYTDDVTISITYESNWRKARQIIESVAEETMRQFVKAQLPVTFAEKRAWQEALSLLQEASKKIKRGFLRKNVTEQIEIMKSAQQQSVSPFPKPKLLISLGASSIDINVIYKIDLHSVRDAKDFFVRRILEEFSKHDDLEFAYPHLELVQPSVEKNLKKNKKLSDFV
ncbi:MAG: mechanosensitive ion channel [Candidatus Diapherotrites archaeon]